MNRLTDLPNIGPVLAANLRKIGVETPEQLRKLGSMEALRRIRVQVDPGACLNDNGYSFPCQFLYCFGRRGNAKFAVCGFFGNSNFHRRPSPLTE